MSKFDFVPAKGTHATVLRTFDPPGFFLRVYKQPISYRTAEAAKQEASQPYDEAAWEHDDYDIHHADFDIVIDEDSSGFYHFADGKKTFDWSPQVLGRKSE